MTRSKTTVAPIAPSRMAKQMQDRADQAADLLKAMANPQRLRVLCLLLEREMSVGELNRQLPLSQSALSQHLAVLRESGMVETRKQAQTVFYAVAPGPVYDIIATLHGAYCCG